MGVLAAAFVPSAPALVPQLTGGAAHELDAVRRAADAAVTDVCAVGGGELPVVVLGGGESSRAYDGSVAASFQPWGFDVRVGDPSGSRTYGLPLSLTVGAWLLDRAGVALGRRSYQGVALDEALSVSAPPAPGGAVADVVLVVVGDGSATRTIKAPGAFHPEAESFDAVAVDALGSGDPARLVDLDPVRARQVKADGVSAWREAGRLLGGRIYDAAVRAAEAPYGLAYVVAVWR